MSGMSRINEAIADQKWWNEIGVLLDTRVHGWSGRYSATFVDGTEIQSRRVAKLLHELAELRLAAEAVKEKSRLALEKV